MSDIAVLVEKTAEEDAYVSSKVRLLNSRRKCEFMASFPEWGSPLKELAERGAFGTSNRSVVHYYLINYDGVFRKDPADNENCKPIRMTEHGRIMKIAARAMVSQAVMLQSDLRVGTDYLSVFFEKSDPANMLMVMEAVFENGVAKQSDIYRRQRDKDTVKMVARLEGFGLVQTRREGAGRSRRVTVKPTEAGTLYYSKIIHPITDLFRAEYLAREEARGS